MCKKKNLRFSVLLCNLVTHYDTTIYILLVPIIAPLVFSDTTLLAITKGYGATLVGILARPWGIVYFSSLANKKGALNALSKSIIGITWATLAMIFVPLESVTSPIMLVLIRTLQAFFAAGESNLAKLYVMKKNSLSHNSLSTIQYEASSLAGIAIASLCAYICSRYPSFWRLAFVLSLPGAVFSTMIRINITHDSDQSPNANHFSQSSTQTLLTFLKNNKNILFKMSFLHGFNYFTYSLAFIFINICTPTINPAVSYEKMLALNLPLLGLDILVLLIFYRYKESIHYVARVASLLPVLLGTLMCITFWQSESPQIYLYVNMLRMCVIIIGTICSVSFTDTLFNASTKISNNKYLAYGVCYCVGSDLLGRSLPAIGMLSIQYTKSYWPLAFFCGTICVVSSFCALSLQKFIKQQ
jgi:hypothetical protein